MILLLVNAKNGNALVHVLEMSRSTNPGIIARE
jgi:hypothetical protein